MPFSVGINPQSRIVPLNLLIVYSALYHYQLWDRRKGAMIAILIALFAAYVPAVVLAVMGMRVDFRTSSYLLLKC